MIEAEAHFVFYVSCCSVSSHSAIQTADTDGQMDLWDEYFEQSFTVNPESGRLQTAELQVVDVDPPINEAPPSTNEVKEAIARLMGGKTADICNIRAELLKAGGEAMIRGLHADLTAAWHSGIIPPDWKRGPSGLQQLMQDNAAHRTRLGAHLSAADASSESLAEVSET